MRPKILLAELYANKKEKMMRSRKRRFTGHQFCPPPYRTKMRLHCKHYGQINWQFTFADSLRLPRHARVCDGLSHARAHMHAAAVVPPPLGPAAFETKVAPTPAGAAAALWWQIQMHVLVGWRRPRGASELPHPRGRPGSDSARPSQRATPHICTEFF